MTLSPVTVQTTPESQPSTPNWIGEVAAFAQILTQTGILAAITERVRFARARMGTYELIDFVVVLIGYALSGEPTLQAFYERLLPFASVFMALFGWKLLPSRAALSRFSDLYPPLASGKQPDLPQELARPLSLSPDRRDAGHQPIAVSPGAASGRTQTQCRCGW